MPAPIVDPTYLTPMEVVKNVHDFYNDAFGNILIVFGILFTLIGVIWPICVAWFYTWLQKKTLELNEQKLEKRIMDLFEPKIQRQGADSLATFHLLRDTEQTFITNLRTNLNVIENQIQNLQIQTQASIHFLIAKDHLLQEKFKLALEYFCKAIDIHHSNKNKQEIKSILHTIYEGYDGHFKIHSPKEYLTELKEIIAKLETYNDTNYFGTYFEWIGAIINNSTIKEESC